MIILYITPIFPPLTGGASTYFGILAKYMSRKQGIQKIIFLTSYAVGVPCKQKGDKKVFLRILPPTFIFRPRLLGPALANIFLPPFVFLLTLRIIRTYGVNVIHFFANPLYTRGVLPAARLLKVRCVADIRDPLSASNPFLNNSDVVICCAKNILRIAKKAVWSKKIKYVPIPVDKINKYAPSVLKKNRSKYGIPVRSKLICFIGEIHWSKGIFELLEAFKIFEKKNSRFKLLLIGENKTGKKIIKAIKNNRNIIYTGPLPHEEAMMLLQDSELLVLPSKFEGLPRVCLEAIFLGVKFIYPSMVIELKEYFPKYAFSGESPTKLAEIMRTVLEIDQRQEYPIEIHNQEHVINLIFEIYRGACKENY